jgi:hypothetical protein
MSNVLTYSIKYIDTAATIFATSTILGRLVWSGMSAGHTLVIDDADGNEPLYRATAVANNDYFEFDFNGASRSLKVTTIGGGKLLLYPYLP